MTVTLALQAATRRQIMTIPLQAATSRQAITIYLELILVVGLILVGKSWRFLCNLLPDVKS